MKERIQYSLVSAFVFFTFLSTISVAQSGREKVNINNDGWKFIREDIAEASQVNYDDSQWYDITIPHDYNGGIDGVHDDVFTGPSMYKGIGWYRKSLNIDSTDIGKKIFLQFDAACLIADVWINGQYLGQHRGGYTMFSFDITDYANFGSDQNIISVKVDNSNNSQVAPFMQVPFNPYPASFDFAVYGGIYRDVWLIKTGDVKIKKVLISTPEVSESSANVKVISEIINFTNTTQQFTITTNIYDDKNAVIKTITASVEIAANDTASYEHLSDNISSPKLWSPDSPYLYTAETKVSIGTTVLDHVTNPLGFRWFVLRNVAAFQINGEKLFLRGTNRHQDREGFGYALTDAQHREDVEIIKSLGINFLRHAHYPADEAILNACDSLGIFVWLEIPVASCISEQPEFIDNAKQQLTEMITEHYNHPSVILWGLGNESDQSSEASEAYTNTFFTELNSLAKELDPTRPTTSCNLRFSSNWSLVDVYSPQDWSGWYSGVYTSYNPLKLIGEYGSSITLWDHNEDAPKWSQEYAGIYHEYKTARGEQNKNICPGHLSWIAFDFASPRRDRSTNPIPYMNQKGLFMHDRKTPKDVAYFYKSHYTSPEKSPMVYIVSETWLDRFEDGGAKDVWVYSNAEEVELFNGLGENSFGVRTKNAGPLNNTRFQWDDISLTNNILYAKAMVGGVVVTEDTLTLTNVPTDIEDEDILEVFEFRLFQNHPNPFNPSTNISYSLAEKGFVKLKIVNSLGEVISIPVNEEKQSGVYEFSFDGSNLPSGVYFYQIETDHFTEVKKMIILK
ncbi:MAG: DUF4982 domain-containing protein [Melioribacteraceae bacterium]|nr:DUF4982 domain-containing protein [Melioribacteraceae bacterium]MCF8265486.1 DUF4982 domain-containing protein [Melioribacteraceae bacterium]MCF8432730.1 DUF4982 domain-containing protein [Melioribacteraceae bacterium]